MAQANTFSRSDEGTDNNDDNNDNYDNENNDDDVDSIGSNPSLYESDNTQELNNENERSQSDSYIFNFLNRTASSGRYILNNLFNRNRRSDDHRGRDL